MSKKLRKFSQTIFPGSISKDKKRTTSEDASVNQAEKEEEERKETDLIKNGTLQAITGLSLCFNHVIQGN